MMRRRIHSAILIALLLLATSAFADRSSVGEGLGVVVVETEASGALARGGILVGDRVLSCAVGAHGWPVRTPLDLLECEWELESRGPVSLRVARGEDRLERVIPPGDWQATVRLASPARGASGTREGEAVDFWLAIERAGELREQRQFDHAAREVGKALSLAKASISPRHELAALWAQMELLEARKAGEGIRLQNALRLQQAAARLRDRPLVRIVMSYHVGWHQTSLKQLDEAEGTFLKALEELRAIVSAPSLLRGRLEGYLANVAAAAGDVEIARSRFRVALETFESLRSASLIQGWTYGALGILEAQRGDAASAISAYDRQIAVYGALEAEALTVFPLYNTGIAAEHLGDFRRAETALAKAIEIKERVDGSLESLLGASLFGQRGYLHLSWGRLGTAAEYNLRAHQILERLGSPDSSLAKSFARLGHVARYRGDLDGAEAHYLAALALYEELDDPRGASLHLSNLGNLARQRKDFETALAFYEKALVGVEPNWRGRVLSNLGRTHLLLGRADDAEPFLKESLELKRELSPRTLDVAASLMLLGDLERARENLDQAGAQYRAALALHSELVPGRPAEAENQVRLGQLLVDQADHAAAEPLLVAAVATTEARASGTAVSADALYHLARLRVARGERQQGLDLHRRAVQALDVQWQKLGGSRDSRLSWMHAHSDYYRTYLELLVEEGREEEAFDLLQRYRARGLRDVLAQRDLSLLRNDQAQAIENRLVDLARQRESLLETLDGASPESELQDARIVLAGLRSQRERLLAELRVAAPDLARLKYPAALTLREVGAALDRGTVLISFSVGRQRTLAFAARQRGGGVDLDVQRLPIGRRVLSERVATFRRSIERHHPDELEALQEQAAALYELLLAPMDEILAESQRLLVVPDGPLHGLPFAALRREASYLIDWKPMHLAASATAYADLGRLVAPGRKSVAFGDPSFSESAEVIRSVRGTELRRLPGTRREVEAIGRVLPPPLETFLGRQATEERVKQLRVGRFVHFASHAVVNQELPLDSALALAPPATGSGRENGLLYAWEIIEQMRLEASLVTLSACETALGREVEGEGILGLVWAFHTVGAKSVIASLWNVEDRSTSDLMAELYTGLAAGLDKDEALRLAQLRQLAAARSSPASAARGVGGLVSKDRSTTAHPFYWAAFQLYGSIHP
ncbi:MAG: CHAT domain-containing protein [Acidobacteriota bacterium]